MKKGISLIVLIITIIVMIILATVIILNLSQENISGRAVESVFKSDIASFNDELTLYISNQKLEAASNGTTFQASSINADATSLTQDEIPGVDLAGKNINDVLPSLAGSDYAENITIVDGKLTGDFTGDQKTWFDKVVGNN